MGTDELIERRALDVAIVTETWPPEINGVAGSIARVVEELRALGHAPRLVRPRQGGDAAGAAAGSADGELLVGGMPLPRYPGLTMGLPCVPTLLRHWRARRPDLVHLVTEGPLGWSAQFAARRLGLPMVSEFRTNFHAYGRHYGVGWLERPIVAALRHFHNRTACTMVPTEALRGELHGRGFRRLRVIARGVDTVRFDPQRRSDALRQRWGADAQVPVALYVGRLAPEKNLQTLVAAARCMRQQTPSLRLVVVGDGPARGWLQQQLADAVFAGTRSGTDLADHYASADIFLFPSRTETFGNVVPEAMASGLAVVAYDHAAAAQLILGGSNGLLAPVHDEPAFCLLATRVAGDRLLARRLGAHARLSALQLSWRRIAEAVAAVHDAALRPASNPTALALDGPLPTA